MKDPYSLLIRWVSHHQKRSFAQITAACKSLANDFSIQAFSPQQAIFGPLFRIGLIEFTGSGKFQLAPPVVVQNEEMKFCTVLNPDDTQKSFLADHFDIEEPVFNIVKFKYAILGI